MSEQALDLGDTVEPLEAATGVATVNDLSVVHGTLIADMKRVLTSGKATAAQWGVIAKVLSDNSIHSGLGSKGAVDELKAQLDAKRRARREAREAGTVIPVGLIEQAEATLDRLK